MKLPRLTMIYPYYNAPGMLSVHLVAWDSFPSEVLSRVSMIVVDDGSSRTAIDVIRRRYGGAPPFDLRLFKVLVDIPWNQHGARNLGAREADDGWIFLSDIDHTVPLKSVETLFDQDLDPESFYTFARLTAETDDQGKTQYSPMVDKAGKPKPHPNTFLLTKGVYWRAGGYDEDYCGTYGGDGPFRRELDREATHRHLKIPIVRWPRDVVPDASMPPKMREDYKGLYYPLFKKKGGGGAPKPESWVRFPWERQI